MINTIDQFMWGYQQHFQSHLNFFAKNLFGKLDKNLNPRTFLVGLLYEDRNDRHKICLEPEDCGYHQSDFQDIKNLASQLQSIDPEANIFHTHPIAQKNHDEWIQLKSLREAMLKIIKKKHFQKDFLSFVSYPTQKNGYFIFLILQISKSVYESYYRLTKDKFLDRYTLSTSLIKSTINKYNEVGAKELYKPNAGADLGFSEYEKDEIIKSAGKDLMYTVSSKGQQLESLHGLFSTCNIISSLKYEGEESNGGIIIAPKDHQNITFILKLENPILLTEYRKTRKLLELSDRNNFLVSDSLKIYGLGQVKGSYNPCNEDLFKIIFSKHYHWEIVHDDNCLMKVAYNQPYLPQPKINRTKFMSDIKRIFSDISKKNIKNLYDIVIESINQKHGTMLLISSHAMEEANRLENQSTIISTLKLTIELVPKITSIDGCVILSPDGICYAIGAILDGMATKKGDSARGARYNSAIKYFELVKEKHNCIIFIISEDGMVDVLPNLNPQIKKSTIKENIKGLEIILTNKDENNINKKYCKHINWLEKNQFYLSQKECDHINSLRSKIENKLYSNMEEGVIRIIRFDLKPNSEMNDSYFL